MRIFRHSSTLSVSQIKTGRVTFLYPSDYVDPNCNGPNGAGYIYTTIDSEAVPWATLEKVVSMWVPTVIASLPSCGLLKVTSTAEQNTFSDC